MVCKPSGNGRPSVVAGDHVYDLVKTDMDYAADAELGYMSLHPMPAAVPLSAPDVSGWFGGSTPQGENAHHAEVLKYSSLMELRTLWRSLDRMDDALRLTIVLILGENFAGFLPGLIRRQHPALRLVIAAPAGRLPGFIDVGDLAYSTANLGFHMIAVHGNVESAIADGNSPLALQERCVMFVPELTKAQQPSAS